LLSSSIEEDKKDKKDKEKRGEELKEEA